MNINLPKHQKDKRIDECPECQSTDIRIHDYKLKCMGCGLELEDCRFDHDYQARQLYDQKTTTMSSPKRNPNSRLYTENYNNPNEWMRYPIGRRLLRWAKFEYSDDVMKLAEVFVKQLANSTNGLNLRPWEVTDILKLFSTIWNNGLHNKQSLILVIAGITRYYLSKKQIPHDLSILIGYSDYSEKSIKNILKKLKKNMAENNVDTNEAFVDNETFMVNYITNFARMNQFPQFITEEIIEQIRKYHYAWRNGENRIGFVAGMVYFNFQRWRVKTDDGVAVTQKWLHEKTGISQVTVRKVYKKLEKILEKEEALEKEEIIIEVYNTEDTEDQN